MLRCRLDFEITQAPIRLLIGSVGAGIDNPHLSLKTGYLAFQFSDAILWCVFGHTKLPMEWTMAASLPSTSGLAAICCMAQRKGQQQELPNQKLNIH